MRHFVPLSTVLAIALASCARCGDKRPDLPAGHVSKDAEMVVELSKLSRIAESRPNLEGLLKPLASKEQIDLLVADLTRQLGFDPTTKAGVEKAGLDPNGAAAIEVLEQGQTVVFVLPVGSESDLKATLESSAQLRGRSHFAFTGGFAIVAVSATNADAHVKKRVALAKEQSILVHPEYVALTKALGNDGLVRIIAPNAQTMAPKLWAQLGQRAGADPAIEKASQQIKSTGFVASVSKQAVQVSGRIRFESAELERIKKMWKSAGSTPKGVTAVDDPSAFLVATGSGDMDALIKAMSSAGFGPKVDAFVQNLKKDLDIDLVSQVLPHLSGHAALSLGFRADAGADIRALLRNPASMIWTNLALGVKNRGALVALESVKDKIDPALATQGLERSEREVAGRTVQSIKLSSNGSVLTESVLTDDAWVFANDPAQTEAIAGRVETSTADPLKSGATVAIKIRFAPVLNALRRFDIASLVGGGAQALLMRALLAKGMMLVATLDHLNVDVKAADDGIAVDAALQFAVSE